MKIFGFLKQAQDMIAHMEKMRGDAQRQTVTVDVGGGAISVVMNGEHELKSIAIKPEAFDPQDPGMLEDLIMSAVNEASRQIRQLMTQQVAGMAQNLNLPGLEELDESDPSLPT